MLLLNWQDVNRKLMQLECHIVFDMMLMVFIFSIFHLPWIKGEKTTFQTTFKQLRALVSILSKMFCFFTGASNTNSIFQTPLFIIKRSASSVVSGINCSHNITNYDVILWYKQEGQGVLKLLGNLNVNFINLEDNVKGKISFDGHGRTNSELTIYNLTLSDSGVYFCAAREHSAAYSLQVNTKTYLYLSAERQQFRLLNTCSFEDSNLNLYDTNLTHTEDKTRDNHWLYIKQLTTHFLYDTVWNLSFKQLLY